MQTYTSSMTEEKSFPFELAWKGNLFTVVFDPEQYESIVSPAFLWLRMRASWCGRFKRVTKRWTYCCSQVRPCTLHSADVGNGLNSQLGWLFKGILLPLFKAHGEAELQVQAEDHNRQEHCAHQAQLPVVSQAQHHSNQNSCSTVRVTWVAGCRIAILKYMKIEFLHLQCPVEQSLLGLQWHLEPITKK